MKQTIATACVLAALAGCAWAGQQPQGGATAPAMAAPNQPAPNQGPPPAPQANHATVPRKKARRVTAVQPPAPEPAPQPAPPLPATLMNSAPVKPSVTMQNGLLTIDAPNSTLNDILLGVRKATGATIEGATPSDRVAVKIGPGTPEQVVAALLQGTPYGYVILGSPDRPDAITRILLTQQQQASAEQPGARPGQPQPPPPAVQEQPDEGMPDRTTPDDAGLQQDQQPETEQQIQQQLPPGQTIAPQAQPTAPQDQSQNPQLNPQLQQQQPQQQQDQNQPKTPEQLFRELQQLEQQKNQQR